MYRRGGYGQRPDKRPPAWNQHDRGGKRQFTKGYGAPRPQTVRIVTNMFQLKFNNNNNLMPPPESEEPWCMQYHVSIHQVERKVEKDETGKRIVDEQGNVKASYVPKASRDGEDRAVKIEEGPTELTRKILEKVSDELYKRDGIMLASDGSQSAYSPKRLFEPKTDDNPTEPTASAVAPSPGIYGGADVCDENRQQQQLADTGKSKVFYVMVPRYCETKNLWFAVRLTEAGPVDFINDEMRARQCVETIAKSSIMGTLHSEGRSPRFFYLRPEDQANIRLLGNKLARDFQDQNRAEIPLTGIMQAARFCKGNENRYLLYDTAVNFFNRARIPLLDPNKRTIAGVEVRDLHSHIVNNDIQDRIRKNLMKLKFDVEYYRNKSTEEYIRQQRAKGLTLEQIEEAAKRRNKRLVKNLRVKISHDGSGPAPIIWVPESHTFEVKAKKYTLPDAGPAPPPDIRTVAQHFMTQYGIKLKYPKMPLINTSQGVFPVEFLLQSFGKTKEANSPFHTKAILGFNDEKSAERRIHHIETTKKYVEAMENKSGRPEVTKWFETFGLSVASKPMALEASVLTEPRIEFGGGRQANISNGSFRLEPFAVPGDMNSYAVLDLAGDSKEFMLKMMSTLKNHGITLPYNVDSELLIDTLTETVRGGANQSNGQVYDGFRAAVEKAKRTFLSEDNVFRRNNSWFRTRCVRENGRTDDCLVVFLKNGEDGKVAPNVILKREVDMPTHFVTHPTTGQELESRIVALVDGDKPVDLFDLRWSSGPQRKNSKGEWIDCSNYRYAMMLKNDEIFELDICKNVRPLHEFCESKLECPAIVFVYLNESERDRYPFIKLLAQFQYGVQTQCIMKEKFKMQRNPAQYLANVALKVNTKLFSSSNKARAWITFSEESIIDRSKNVEGVTWVKEAPTLVIGIALSHENGKGRNPATVVVVSACLDEGCMEMAQEVRIQTKSTIVAGSILKDMVQSVAYTFFLINKLRVERILVIRDGVPDGDFGRLIDIELASIRLAIYELERGREGFSCPNTGWCNGGCVFCTPPITLVVSQNDHGIRVTPEIEPESRDKNVPSGTCVDDERVMAVDIGAATRQVPTEKPEGASLIFEKAGSGGYDFLLTAQGGLKGTSRPVLYRTIVNENAVWKTRSNTTALTKKKLQASIYEMSFQYGTATKAVRSVPVVCYSRRLATVASSYLGYLRGDGRGLKDDGSYYCLKECEIRDDPRMGNQEDTFFHYVRKNPCDDTSADDKVNEIGKVLQDLHFRPHISA